MCQTATTKSNTQSSYQLSQEAWKNAMDISMNSDRWRKEAEEENDVLALLQLDSPQLQPAYWKSKSLMHSKHNLLSRICKELDVLFDEEPSRQQFALADAIRNLIIFSKVMPLEALNEFTRQMIDAYEYDESISCETISAVLEEEEAH